MDVRVLLFFFQCHLDATKIIKNEKIIFYETTFWNSGKLSTPQLLNYHFSHQLQLIRKDKFNHLNHYFNTPPHVWAQNFLLKGKAQHIEWLAFVASALRCSKVICNIQIFSTCNLALKGRALQKFPVTL